ncbi:cysteine ABC transporter substrate-binding protein [Dialister micraerophilus]|uniref:cysteine ABC transporter substrate-binding protein n=1 Tax=Dialister micraerophilus TaxID=309120 RepID=UPI0023EFA721|nr:cysteine ABC transporter substrate-binding protein [Dialister micraerophilus]
MKKITMFLMAIFSILALTFASGCASNSETESKPYRSIAEIKKSGELIIGVFSDKAPFGYIDKNGNYRGYDIYFAERLAKDLGVKPKYISLEPANRTEYAKTGKVDIILANFTVTKERAEQVDFALPYMKVAIGVVSPKNQNITSVEQLKGKKLIVAKGTTAETYFTENHPEVELLKFDQYSETYNALLDKRGDAFSTDNTEVLAWAMKNPEYKVGITHLGKDEVIAPAVQKGNKELLDYINNEIKESAKENFFHKDYEETLAPVYGSSVNPDDLVIEDGKL